MTGETGGGIGTEMIEVDVMSTEGGMGEAEVGGIEMTGMTEGVQNMLHTIAEAANVKEGTLVGMVKGSMGTGGAPFLC